MNARSTGVGADDIVPNVRSDGAGVRSIVRGDRIGYIRACCEFFLDRKVSNDLHSNDRTHVKDLKNIVEIQPPGGNRISVTLRVKPPRNYIPFVPLD